MMWMLAFFTILFFNFKEFSCFSCKLEMDQLNNFILIITMSFYLALTLMKNNNLTNKERKFNNLMYLFVCVFSNMSFFVNNTMLMILSIEMTILPMTLLFLYSSKDKDKLSSLTFMININLSGSILFMFFMSSFAKNLNTLNMFFNFLMNKEFLLSLLFCFMLLSKIPMIFMQFWLTKAHVSASGPCSMLLASVMLKLGSYGIFKFWNLMKTNWIENQELMFMLNIFSILLMSMLMIRFQDLKMLVACSSILHMALTIPFMFNYSTLGVVSSLMLMTNHGITSCLFFYFVTNTYEVTMNRSSDFNKSMESLNKTYPMIMITMLLVNMGIPPLMGLYSEILFLSMMMKMSYAMAIFLTLIMVTFILYNMFAATNTSYGKKTLKLNKNIVLMTKSLTSIMIFMICTLPFCMV